MTSTMRFARGRPLRLVRPVLLAALALLLAAAPLPIAQPTASAATGGLIVFTRVVSGLPRDTDIYSMNPDGTGVTELTSGAALDEDPALSPDGRQIAFYSGSADDNDRYLYVANLDGSGLTRIADVNSDRYPVVIGGPDWSPDGTRIAYTANTATDTRVMVVSPDGTGVTDLGEGSDATWSPDGSKIVFNGGGGTQYCTNSSDGVEVAYGSQFAVVDPDGSGQMPLDLVPSSGWSADSADWHGDRIAFIASPLDVAPADGICDGGVDDVYVANADGSGDLVNATNSPDRVEADPSWSPDGTQIAYGVPIMYEAPEDPPVALHDIYTVPPDGSTAPVGIAVGEPVDFGPSWGPGADAPGGPPSPPPPSEPPPSEPPPSEPPPSEPPPSEPPSGVTRLFGPGRAETAAEISAATFEPGVPAAFVATGGNFPDALTGGLFAAKLGAPILLAGGDDIPQVTVDELTRLQPESIFVLGATAAISTAAEAALNGLTSGAVTRLSGPSRFDTSAAISAAAFPATAGTVFIATGGNFPDALAGGPLAFAEDGPVLLVAGDVPAAIQAELERLRPERVVILGGTGAVSEAVATQLQQITGVVPERLSGASRFDTAAAISAEFEAPTDTVFAATGANFPDALAGVPAAAAAAAPILLVAGDVPTAIQGELDRLLPQSIVILGGTVAVPQVVEDDLEGGLRP